MLYFFSQGLSVLFLSLP